MSNLEKARMTLSQLSTKKEFIENEMNDINIEKISETFEFKQLIKRKRALQINLNNLLDQYANLSTKLEVRTKLNRELNLTLKKNSYARINLESKVSATSSVLNELESENTLLEKDNLNLKKNVEVAEHKLNELKVDLASSEMQLVSLTSDNELLSSESLDLEEVVEKLRLRKEFVNSSITEMEFEVDKRRSSLENDTKYHQKLNDVFLELFNKLSIIEIESLSLQEKKEHIVDNIAELNFKNSTSQGRIDVLSKTNTELKKEIFKLQEMEVLSQMTNSHVEKEYLLYKSKGEKLNKDIGSNRHNLKLLVDELTAQNSILENQKNKHIGQNLLLETIHTLIGSSKEQIKTNTDFLSTLKLVKNKSSITDESAP